jgi:hypothetical protein
VDPDTENALRAYACWHLLALCAEGDRAFSRQARREGRLPPGVAGVFAGVVSARHAFSHLDLVPDELDEAEYRKRVTGERGVARYDAATHTLHLNEGLARVAADPQRLRELAEGELM